MEYQDITVVHPKELALVKVNKKPGTLAKGTLLNELAGVDGLLCLLSDRLYAQILSRPNDSG